MIDTVVFVGGPAAAGKTTITRHLADRFGAASHRPHQAFLTVATARGVPPKRAFDKQVIPEPEVWSTYAGWCKAEKLTIADVHYAIQPQRDSAAAIGGDAREELWPWEPYVPAMPAEFLLYLRRAQLSLGLILVTAEPSELLRRLSARDGSRARSQRVDRLAEEAVAEELFFTSLAGDAGVPSLRVENMNRDLPSLLTEVERFVADLTRRDGARRVTK